ncbi:hypothetical protein EPD83_019495 [Phycicoccus sp. CMS6Z-2]|nr:hypothetical protein [Phycicoccus flavus]
MLVPLRAGFRAEPVVLALAARINTLLEQLPRTLTWDPRVEIRDCKKVQLFADIDIYFCDTHSLWQRSTHNNTNGHVPGSSHARR